MNLWLRIPAAALGLSLALGLTGCGGSDTDDLPREAISGTVTLNGKPLPSGAITFDPDQGTADPVSVGGVVADGSYSIAKAEGPTPGKYRVSIYPSTPGEAVSKDVAPGAPPKHSKPAVQIPAKYNAKTTLAAEIKPGESNTFDFDLDSKAK